MCAGDASWSLRQDDVADRFLCCLLGLAPELVVVRMLRNDDEEAATWV